MNYQFIRRDAPWCVRCFLLMVLFMIGCYHPSATYGHLAYGVGVLRHFAGYFHIPRVIPWAYILRPFRTSTAVALSL